MENELTLQIIQGAKDTVNTAAREEIQNILNLISTMEITQLEQSLDDEMESGRLGKYFLLAALRDAFIRMKNLGDTVLLVEGGKCKGNCYNNCHVFNVTGNVSGKSLAFVLLKEEGRMSGIHFCYNFINHKNENVAPDAELLFYAKKKECEMSKQDVSGWDDEKYMKMIEETIEIFYDL